jgi:hypothetical protein
MCSVEHEILVTSPYFYLQFQEVLSISCLTAQLHVTLVGKGVSPLVSLSPAIAENGIMDMGAVLAGEYLERTFKVCKNFPGLW